MKSRSRTCEIGFSVCLRVRKKMRYWAYDLCEWTEPKQTSPSGSVCSGQFYWFKTGVNLKHNLKHTKKFKNNLKQLQLLNPSKQILWFRHIYSAFPQFRWCCFGRGLHWNKLKTHSFVSYILKELLWVSCGAATENTAIHRQPKFKRNAERCPWSSRQACQGLSLLHAKRQSAASYLSSEDTQQHTKLC